MFSTKNVEESNGLVSKYIKPGIGEYKVQKTEVVTSQAGTKGIRLSIESRPLADLNNEPQTGDFTIWFSENSMKMGLQQIVELGKANGFNKEYLDGIEAPSIEEYCAKITPFMTKEFIRIKFRGEEIMNNNNGKIWQKATLPIYSFAESLSTNPSKLKYDEAVDLKKLPTPDMETVSASDDLPF
jgi:hypothetical protein